MEMLEWQSRNKVAKALRSLGYWQKSMKKVGVTDIWYPFFNVSHLGGYIEGHFIR